MCEYVFDVLSDKAALFEGKAGGEVGCVVAPPSPRGGCFGDVGLFYEQRFPQSLPDVALAAAAEGSLTVTPYIYICEMSGLYGQLFQLDRQLGDAPRMQGVAGLGQRTEQAAWRLWRTLDGPEVHHGLVESCWLSVRQQRLRQLCEEMLAFGGVDGCVDAEVARQDAVDVSVDNGNGLSESDAGDGGGGVVAHAFQLSDVVEGVGEVSQIDNLPCGGVQVARAAVVAQSLPLAQHLVLGSGGELFYGWPAVHEAFPVGLSLLYARLLQDDFAEPDGVRVTRVAPGEVASVFGKPEEEGWDDASHLCDGGWGCVF